MGHCSARELAPVFNRVLLPIACVVAADIAIFTSAETGSGQSAYQSNEPLSVLWVMWVNHRKPDIVQFKLLITSACMVIVDSEQFST